VQVDFYNPELVAAITSMTATLAYMYFVLSVQMCFFVVYLYMSMYVNYTTETICTCLPCYVIKVMNVHIMSYTSFAVFDNG